MKIPWTKAQNLDYANFTEPPFRAGSPHFVLAHPVTQTNAKL